eukprot:m.82365 g.82365  ORF g.82365 m.82365 type:complete len:52 (-) comp9460_c0_seq1:1309-1464(-)
MCLSACTNQPTTNHSLIPALQWTTLPGDFNHHHMIQTADTDSQRSLFAVVS